MNLRKTAILGALIMIWGCLSSAPAKALDLPDPVKDEQFAGIQDERPQAEKPVDLEIDRAVGQAVGNDAVEQAFDKTVKPETIVLAGGCFWGMEAVFLHVKGVKNVVSGYTGGAKDTATYEQVGSGKTGHAEAVEVTYDPSQITLGKLLKIYFSVAHNPTELNRQGPDTGTQYRSAIFYATPRQKDIADSYIKQLDEAKLFDKKIATTLEPLEQFYPAESYHQDYVAFHPDSMYVMIHDLPKVQALKDTFPDLYAK